VLFIMVVMGYGCLRWVELEEIFIKVGGFIGF